MFIESEGIYAILDGYHTFIEWRLLTIGRECNPDFVLPQTSESTPDYNPKTQKLEENITVRDTDVLQSWVVVNLNPDEIAANKKPNPKGFAVEMITNPDLLAIYLKGRDGSAESQKWFNEVRTALSLVYIPQGFQGIVNAFAQSIPLTKQEIDTLNQSLDKYDLELITWDGV